MDPAFLTLPPEVIRTSMRTHQKYFAVRDPKTGKLAPNFVTVANVEAADGGQEIKRGNAKVLSARLNDARFFWDEDQKGANFDRWLDKLKGVTFHAKLGTMAERVERIAKLSRAIAPLVGADADMAEKAARLLKADLASGMVGEFPELQGIMGSYYAEAKGLDQGLADAIRDHYKPQGPSDTVPTAPLSLSVALADKLDTLVGFFAIDEKPTGSKDPFALRRAALGIVRLILTAKVRVSLKSVLETALSQFPQGAADTVTSLEVFFADRLKVQLKEEGVASDLVDAVFALGDDDLVRVVARVEALKAMLETEDGKNLLAGYKRAANILAAEAKKGAKIPQATDAFVQLDNAQPEAEMKLRAQLAEIEPKVRVFLQKETFSDVMTTLSSLRSSVDAFLEDVLVNSEIPQERMNRLTLLVKVRDLMGLCADFSKVTG